MGFFLKTEYKTCCGSCVAAASAMLTGRNGCISIQLACRFPLNSFTGSTELSEKTCESGHHRDRLIAFYTYAKTEFSLIAAAL